MNEELTRYYYDKILERNVYGVVAMVVPEGGRY